LLTSSFIVVDGCVASIVVYCMYQVLQIPPSPPK
jgi:hypothetical protein